MTAIDDRRPPPAPSVPEWLAPLQVHVERARDLLGGPGQGAEQGGENASLRPADAGRAEQALRQASDALMVVRDDFGVDTPIGWRLHELRSRLDAHLLAASALADADAGDAVVSVLRRSLDLVGPELDALGASGKSVDAFAL